MHRDGHHELDDELSSSVELTHIDGSPHLHTSDTGFHVEHSEQPAPFNSLSSMTVVFLTFVLLLSMWDTWSTLTEILAPLPESFVLRVLLNVKLCLLAKLAIRRFEKGRMVIIANLVLGMGVWEMAESMIEMVFGSAIVMKLFFYICCLLFTSLIIIYLETAKGMNVLDNELVVSPI